VRVQLYTVPGQVRYNSTRKLVLSGTDGVVFVTDSQLELMDENLRSWKNLVENLEEHGLNLGSLPHILQYNKRDLPKIVAVDELNARLNRFSAPAFETCATSGMGILDGLKTIARLVMEDLNKKGVVDKKKVRPFVPRSKTDTMARPMVGMSAGSVEEVAVAAPKAVVSDPFFQPPGKRAAFYDGLFTEEERALDTLAGAKPSPAALPEAELEPETDAEEGAEGGFSFATVFDDPETRRRVYALEREVPFGGRAELAKHAQEIFFDIIEDEEVFPADMPEAMRVAMLGVSLRRYAHFHKLLGSSTLDTVDCLFILHFLTDLHFGKTIG